MTRHRSHAKSLFRCATHSRSVGTVALLLTLGATAQAEQQSPEKVYAGRANNLEQLPAGWVDDHPVELVVSFNLDSPPNSPESNAFLRKWYESISGLPYDVKLAVKRLVAPAPYTYAVSLTFTNWAAYREYETSDDFLRYYYAEWKPKVHEADEQVYILDRAATRADHGGAKD